MTEAPADYRSGRVIYSVSRLNQEVKQLLELSFPAIWLEAELSNFSRPSSGHWYMTLKDSGAQLRCAMFRGDNRRCQITPREGLQVLVRGRLTIYPARGEYQLVIDHMEDAGEGALQRAFEALRRKLEDEGLFDPAAKQPLPAMPQRIGVITSGTGAALRDVLSVLRRRFPLCEVTLYPVPVQGEAAPPAICQALSTATRRNECDLLLLVRGGGSLEDLWAFNEESVARAIAACPLPIISGVGHETDTSIADLVADHRAPTPTAAAEQAVPDMREWQDRLRAQQRQLILLQRGRAATLRGAWQSLQSRLHRTHPQRQLETRAQRLDEFQSRLQRSVTNCIALRQQQQTASRHRLHQANPAPTLARHRLDLQQLGARSQRAVVQQITGANNRLAVQGAALQQLSPLTTLARGYAVATAASGEVIRSAARLNPGDPIDVRLHDGHLACTVDSTDPDNSNGEPS